MPMDYDDNEFSIHNVELTEEGSSTVSPVLRPYDFEDVGQLSFDSLVENEVFLGITGQEDNQWIEEYSRGTSSGVTESRRENVWSEAASSESVEMLLKSVGQGTLVTQSSDEPGSLATNMDPNLKQNDGNNHAHKAMVTNKELGALVTEELDASDDPCNLTTNVDPNLKQDDGNNHAHEAMMINKPQDHSSGSNASVDCDKFYVTITKNSQEEAKVTGGELDSDVLGNECDDVNHEVRNIAVDLSENNLQDLSPSKIEFGNLDASKECNLKKCSNEPECSTKDMDNSIGSQTAVETCTNSDEKPSNVKSLDKSPFAVDFRVDEVALPAGSCNLLMTEACAEVSHELNTDHMHEDLTPVSVEDDDKTKSENVCSPSKVLDVQSCYTEESEKPDSVFEPSEMCEGSGINDVGSEMTNMPSSSELIIGNTDLVTTPEVHSENSNKDQSETAKLSGSVTQQIKDEVQSSDQDDGMCIDHNFTFHEGENARLPFDMDIAAVDSQQNVESASSAKGCKAEESEADITISAEPVAAVKYDLVSSSDTSDRVHLHSGNVATGYIDASSVHHDNKEKKEEGFVSDGTCENESLKVVSSMVDCASLSVVETGASAESTEEGVDGTSIENMNAIMNHLPEEANPDGPLSTVDPIPCDSSAKVGDNVESGGDMQESISGHHVNMSIEHHASTDAVLTSEYNESHMKHEEDGSISMDKLQAVSPLLNTNDTEHSQSTRVEPCEGAIDENTSLTEATAYMVLTSECNGGHMRHEEDSSVCTNKLQSVSSFLNPNSTELSQSTRVTSEGVINEDTSYPEATEDVAVISECDDSHMRHEEDGSVFMDKLHSVSPLFNRDNTELSRSTGTKHSEGGINDNTSLPEAADGVMLTSECDDSQTRHEEDSSVSMDKHQSVSPLLNTNNTELSESTRVETSEGVIDDNTSLPEATEDVVLTSACDDGHMRHEEDGSVSMDKLHSVSPLLNTDMTEPFQSTGTKHTEGCINENTSLPEAADDAALTSECDDSRTRHEEDSSVSMDKHESLTLRLNTNNTELSSGTRVKRSECDINENTSLPEAADDVVLTSECNYSHTRHEEGSFVSADKLQSVSPLLNTDNTEISTNTNGKPGDSSINENNPLPEAAEHVVLNTECDDIHMRHELSELSELQSVSPLLNTNNTELSQSTRVAINENIPLPDVVLTSECDDSHVRHEEDSSVFMDKVQSGSPLLNTKNTDLSQSTRVKPSDGAINENTPLPEAAEDVVLTSACDDGHVRHEEDGSLSTDKLQSVSPLLNTSSTELSHNTSVKPVEGAINENASLPEATEDVQEKEQSISSNSNLKIDKSFTFEVSETAGLRETCMGLQLFPVSQACNSSMAMEVPCIDSTSNTLDPRKPNEAPVGTPQTPGSGTIFTGGKERQTRRKSVGKESVKKDKETTPVRSGRVKNSSPLLGSKEKVECSVTKPIPISNLPDLNNAACMFHQPFTNNQQVQLRAQILVYGSLISGMPPEEPHMIAAFGESDAGRKIWEDVWHACLERANSQKSYVSTPVVQQPRSDLKDVGLSSMIKGTPPAVSPLSPIPSPLWNMSTPSCVGFQSRTYTSIHHPTYQTPPNPLWLSQSPFFGQWGVASSPGFSGPRFSGLPITEAVKLTPVKFSGMPVVHSTLFSSESTDGKQASSGSKSRKRKKVTDSVSSVPSQVLMTPPSAHVGPSFSYNRFPFLVENQTDSVTAPVTSILAGNAEDMLKKAEDCNIKEADVNATKTWRHSSDSRSTKRTKVTTSPAVNQTPVSTQATPVVYYLPQVLGNEMSLPPPQNQTISVSAPAFCTSFSTSVATSAPVFITSDIIPRTGYQKMENISAVEEILTKVKESKLEAENAAVLAAADVSNCQAVWSGVVSDAEAKLMSSIAAATTVAKMASAAAKIASNAAEQAKLMVDEVFQSSKTENTESFSHVSHPDVINKVTPASILKNMDKTTDSRPNSVISAAREAARRRIEAASAASKHAENLDAVVKAAELAAEAVSQVGKIVAVSDPSALRKLAEAGPEGFWKISQSAYEQNQVGENTGLHLNSKSGKKNVPVLLDTSYGVTSNERDTPGIWKEHNIKEGCLVEVYKENGKYKGAWLAANVLSFKDEKALVCYNGIQSSEEGSENIKEWVAFELEGNEEVPKIRVAHPMTTMRFGGTGKRRRTAVTDYAWSKGDRVDVWMQDCWREGVVVEPNKIDVTFLTVQLPAQGEPSIVRSWHVRPTLIWKDRKWIEWDGGSASQGEMPKEKRMKLGSHVAVNDKMDKLPLLSAHESGFNVGKTTNKPNSNLRPIQKERSKVVFGVPKPGKKQKFMAVSTQYIDDRSNKNITTNGSFKFSKPPGARGPTNDSVQNQVTETKSRLKSRKPPVPCFRTTTSRDSEPTDADSVENSSSRQNQLQVGSSSNNNRRDPAKGPTLRKPFTFTSKPKSEQFNRGKLQVAPKIEVKDKSVSQVSEPRRSNRKIQPTSRLLEGLQSSLTVSKIPSVSHAAQRKVISKGNTSHGSS